MSTSKEFSNVPCKPLLVVGTGFNKEILRCSNILSDWQKLLREIAYQENVDVDICAKDLFSISWEKILNEIVKKNKSLQVNDAENIARKSAASLLKCKSDEVRKNEKNGPNILNWPVSDIISLNYEASWIAKNEIWKKDNDLWKKKKFIKKFRYSKNIEIERLYRRVTVSNKRIWFPNGHVQLAESLRLGLRDFGFQAPALNEAFNQFKKWEKSVVGDERKGDVPVNVEIGRQALLTLSQ